MIFYKDKQCSRGLEGQRKINLIHIARGKVDDRLQLVLQMAKDQGIKVVRAQKLI